MRSLLLLIALLSVVVTAVPADPEVDPASEDALADQPMDDLSLDFSPKDLPLEDSIPLTDASPTPESEAPLFHSNSEATEDGFKLESVDTPNSLVTEGRGKDENGVIQPNFRTTLTTEKAPTSTKKKTTKKRRNSFNNLVNFPGLKRSNGRFLGGLGNARKARFKPNFNKYDKVDYQGLLNGMKFKPNLKKSAHTANAKTAGRSTRKRTKKQKGRRSGSSSD